MGGSQSKVTFHLSGLFGQKGLVLASLNERSKVFAYIFPATTLQIPEFYSTVEEELSSSHP